MSKPPTDQLLNTAAEMRAAGSKWDAVAKATKRSAETVRDWPRKNPERWQAAFHAAERRLVTEVAAESVLVLRTLLRSDDEKVRRDAANSLMALRLDFAKLDGADATPLDPPTSEAARLVPFLNGHPDDELAQFAAAVHPFLPAPASLPPESIPVDCAV